MTMSVKESPVTEFDFFADADGDADGDEEAEVAAKKPEDSFPLNVLKKAISERE